VRLRCTREAHGANLLLEPVLALQPGTVGRCAGQKITPRP